LDRQQLSPLDIHLYQARFVYGVSKEVVQADAGSIHRFALSGPDASDPFVMSIGFDKPNRSSLPANTRFVDGHIPDEVQSQVMAKARKNRRFGLKGIDARNMLRKKHCINSDVRT